MALRLARRRCSITLAAIVALAVSGQAQTRTQRPQTPLGQLATDLRAVTAMPGVKRGLWGVVAYSLTRRQPLFESVVLARIERPMESPRFAPGGEFHIVLSSPARKLQDVPPCAPLHVAACSSSVGIRPGRDGWPNGLP